MATFGTRLPAAHPLPHRYRRGVHVLRLLPPGGEQLRFRSHHPTESHEFVMLNSNKRSVALDLKTDSGRQRCSTWSRPPTCVRR